uniref:PHD-type domain-containing protein n=1 Tax=Aegilops tauschii subsp. strangulata TaxID=200361 RepID=A0A453R320_AEGTS
MLNLPTQCWHMLEECSTVGCQVTFHPACARDAGLYMNTKKFGSLWQHKAYCGNHSIEQKKVDSQQYGPAEVKIMKQMRVELERLRLLCERVVKREKEKKELLVCEHDILAVKRDYVAFSMRASCYTPAPGASSESATTSVNNNSYGGKRQRSDDITVRSDDVTVDSTIPRKHTIRFPVHSKDTDIGIQLTVRHQQYHTSVSWMMWNHSLLRIFKKEQLLPCRNQKTEKQSQQIMPCRNQKTEKQSQQIMPCRNQKTEKQSQQIMPCRNQKTEKQSQQIMPCRNQKTEK